MEQEKIPTHHLEGHGHRTVTFERILPCAEEVRNSVHRHDHYELFVFFRGSGTHMIDLRPFALEAPCLHTVESGQVHHLVRSGDTDGFVIMFEPVALADPGRMKDTRHLFDAMAEKPVLRLSDDRVAILRDIATAIEREQSVQENGYDRVLESYLGIAVNKCAQWSGTRGVPQLAKDAYDIVGRFRSLVEKDFANMKQVNEYAELLNVTPGYLNDKVRERLGTNASGVIHARLMLEAKRLLLHSELSVKEASFALGMQDPAYFTRWFKKLEGMGPVEYRAKVRVQYS